MPTIEIKVQADHVESLAKVTNPVMAIEELIWNSLDADASEINVVFEKNPLGGCVRIVVADDGEGIDWSQRNACFGNLGGSSKPITGKTKKGRKPHGRKGRGRFKAFGIAGEVTWHTTFKKRGGIYQKFQIGTTVNALQNFQATEPVDAPGRMTGTVVSLASLDPKADQLLEADAIVELTRRLAIYLTKHPEVAVIYDGTKLDPRILKIAEYSYPISFETQDGRNVEGELIIIEWREKVERMLFLCDEVGTVRDETTPRVNPKGFHFTAYYLSRFISEMDELGLLAFLDTPDMSTLLSTVRDQLRTHFREREASQAGVLVEGWKEQEVYPYSENLNPVEKVESEVFDICALKINQYLPGFQDWKKESKDLTFRLIKEALKSSPSSLKKILGEVLNLPPDQLEEMAQLLERTTLSSLLKASKIVTERIAFIQSLNSLLFDLYRESLKERKQLHRILAQELWIFGEQYLMAADDESLSTVLTSHLDLLGRSDMIADDQVVDLNGRKRIVDLMLYSRQAQSEPNNFEHLIIELKRPNHHLEMKDLNQIKEYAYAVSENARFDKTSTRWNFYLIGTHLTATAKKECNQSDRTVGHIVCQDHINVYVKTWGQLLNEVTWRYEFYRKHLNYKATVEDGLSYLRERHEAYLPDLS